jgi:hypothetical protein
MEKKETLEEVAKKLTKDFPHYSVRDRISDSDIKRWFLEALQKGAKWQAEKMYSEEEALEIINSFEELCYNYQSNKSWFPAKKSEFLKNKFKKK